MHKDLTKGSEGAVIFSFAVPMMGSMLLQTLYTLADSLIVGNAIGSSAIGAIGITGAIVWLVNVICQGLGSGASIAAAQYVGAKRGDDVKKLYTTGLIAGGVIALIVTVLCILLSRPVIVTFLQTPESILSDSLGYFRVISLGLIFQMLYNIFYGMLRAHGNSAGAIWFLLTAAVLNVGLDLLFVITFGWGVAGAAWATVISQAGCAGAAWLYLNNKLPQLRLTAIPFRWDPGQHGRLMELSVPIVLQNSVSAIGFIILQRLVNSFGTASIEGYAAMQKVESLIHIPGGAFSTALAGFVGQNIGAGKLDRVKRGYRVTIGLSMSICAVLAVVGFFVARPVIGLFNLEGEALNRGVEHLHIICLFILMTNLNNVTAGVLQGAGDVRTPAVSSFVNLAIRLASAYIMASTAIGFRSIYYSLPLAWTVACVIVVVRYRSGRWVSKGIITNSNSI